MAVTVDKSSPLYDFWDGGEYDPDATPVRLPLTCPSCICPEEDQEGANNHERGGSAVARYKCNPEVGRYVLSLTSAGEGNVWEARGALRTILQYEISGDVICSCIRRLVYQTSLFDGSHYLRRYYYEGLFDLLASEMKGRDLSPIKELEPDFELPDDGGGRRLIDFVHAYLRKTKYSDLDAADQSNFINVPHYTAVEELTRVIYSTMDLPKPENPFYAVDGGLEKRLLGLLRLTSMV